LKTKDRKRLRRSANEEVKDSHKRKRFSTLIEDISEEPGRKEVNRVVRERRLFGRLGLKGLIYQNSSRQEDANDPISLSMIQWQRRSQQGAEETQADDKLLSIENKVLSPMLAEAGLEYQPRGENIIQASDQTQGDPIRKLSDKFYASCCMKLIHALKGKARNWAFHEFFYSDIDRAW
jgi:hypothetical protein